jgi:hypothetical protein
MTHKTVFRTLTAPDRVALVRRHYQELVLSGTARDELVRRNVLLATVADCRRAGFIQYDSYIPIPGPRGLAVTEQLVLFREREAVARAESLIFTLGVVDIRGFRRWYGLEAWPGTDLPPGVWGGLTPEGRREVLALTGRNLTRLLRELAGSVRLDRLRFPGPGQECNVSGPGRV